MSLNSFFFFFLIASFTSLHNSSRAILTEKICLVGVWITQQKRVIVLDMVERGSVDDRLLDRRRTPEIPDPDLVVFIRTVFGHFYTDILSGIAAARFLYGQRIKGSPGSQVEKFEVFRCN